MSDEIELVVSGRKHLYRYNGAEGPSVTTILKGGMPQGPGLINWHGAKTSEIAIKQRKHWWAIAEQSEETAISMLSQARYQERDAAANLGAAVHKIIEREETPSEVEAPFVDSYRAWRDAAGVTTVASEFKVFNTEHLYGGTGDVVLDHPEKGRKLFDVKTGKTAGWPDQQLQVVGYEKCDVGLPEGITGAGILHVRPEGVKVYDVDISPDVFDVFLAVLKLYRWLQEGKD